MNQENSNKIHWSFWATTFFMLIWNLMGSINFFMQLNPEMISNYRETEQAIIQGRPLWATIGFAFSVFGGTLGCVLLLLKQPIAFYLFVASLVGTLIAVVHSLTLDISFGAGEIIGIVFMPVAIDLFLIWYTKYTQGKGWLGS